MVLFRAVLLVLARWLVMIVNVWICLIFCLEEGMAPGAGGVAR